MSEALSSAGTAPAPQNIITLRTLIQQRQARGERFRLGEVVAIVVPICTELAKRHATGELVYVHPSSIGAGPDGTPRLLPALARQRPTDPRDQASMAPELASSGPTARSSVYGIAAIVYEMLTLQPVVSGMKPPSQIVQGLPPIVDTILAKALVTDITQRPDDLPAFAQAIHHFAPKSIAPPPPANEAAFEVDLDLRSSMLPPADSSIEIAIAMPDIPPAPSAPRISSDDPFAAVAARPSSPSAPGRTSQDRAVEELAALKARLEADTSPRWMVVKDKMDHGPFAAIELLQQIASNTFRPTDLLMDTHSGSKCVIKDHPEFSRFAHHAHLKREEVKEKREVVAAEKQEKVAGASKAVFGIVALVAALGLVGFVVYKIQKGKAEEEARRRDEEAASIAGEGSIKGKAQDKPKPTWNGGGGGGGGYGGKGYDEALKGSTSDMDAEMLSTAECAAPVQGGIAAACGLNGKATAKYVVQKGKATGVTVTTDPPQPGVNSCMASRIGSLSWRSVPGVTGCIRTFKAN